MFSYQYLFIIFDLFINAVPYSCCNSQVFDNSDVNLCESYPEFIVVPTLMSDSDIRDASAFRSQRRLPAVTYRHAATGAVLTRSAQPMVGLTQKTSRQDQALLNLYRLHGKTVDPKYVHSFVHSFIYLLHHDCHYFM